MAPTPRSEKSMLAFVWSIVLGGNQYNFKLLSVILDTQFKDDPRCPTTRAEVSVLSRHLQVYATELKFDSEYTGFRHIISSYPILISSFGFLVNFSVIFLLLLIGDLARLTSVFDPVFRDHAIKLFCRHWFGWKLRIYWRPPKRVLSKNFDALFMALIQLIKIKRNLTQTQV